MADNYTLCLVGAMDSLWFYQIILFPEPISLLPPKTPQPIPNSITAPSSNISQSPLQNQEFPFDSSHITPPQVDCNNEDEEHEISLTKPKTRSYSSSPSTPKQRSRKLYYSSSMGTLPNKTMVRNCKSLWDLERQEVKGFIDLGFIFKKEEISPRMMSVIPGLQRLGEFKKNDQVVLFDDAADQAGKEDDIVDDEQEEEEEEEKNRGILRPYLSESWLIKRPDSPLLNLRVPRVSAAADMKKHLRFWARTVASEIQQES